MYKAFIKQERTGQVLAEVKKTSYYLFFMFKKETFKYYLHHLFRIKHVVSDAKMMGLSKQAVKVISDLEFQEKYYFTKDDIRKHFNNEKQLYDFIYYQRKNLRIIKLNRDKYFLVPIKARHSLWTDSPFIVADEMMNGEGYYIGGWYSAKYWKLTDQVPMQVDIYSPNKFGKIKIMNKRFVFHRIRPSGLKKGVPKKINGHSFIIMSKEETEKWFSKK